MMTGNNNAIPVLIDSAGQLGTVSSSCRFKKEIKPMDKSSEAILSLKPVSFHYKSDETNRPEFGLIAEEVAQVNPDLVVRDENGDIIPSDLLSRKFRSTRNPILPTSGIVP
jgi:Chaperone of endosialidase